MTDEEPIDREQVNRYRASLQDELNGVALYEGLAEAETNPQIATVYRRLAGVEQSHANTWLQRLRAAGAEPPRFGLSFRTRMLIWLAKRFGVGTVLPSISSLEQVDSRKYGQQKDADTLARDEQSHARLLNAITQSKSGELDGSAVAQIEGRHRTGGNALRAAVLGANDGLVSNLSLVMGVAGAELSPGAILVTGFAGLLAGACSMALGEWLSVQSSRELYERQIGIEKQEIAAAPKEEAEELALIYQGRGIPEQQARELASRILQDQASALDTLSREELGIDPKELGGSAYEAAITSFLLFAAGAIVPVIPFIFFHGITAAILSLVLSTFGLFVIGAGTTLFTGRTLLFSGTRSVAFGLAAAAVTFGIGRLIGARVAG
ncbi:MAG: VIT1/CCC1 transporter family protein [Chloroflexi bacterium]|nr:VIT1/CCC1 transporter family protein [Chloroflexota bacterium]